MNRWLVLCNPSLTSLICDYIGGEFVTQLVLIQEIRDYVDDEEFRKRWRESKLANKKTLVEYIKKTMQIELPLNAIFDTQVKRIHEYNRLLLNIL